MLSTNEYVHVFAFDFSKEFDTARHSTLMSKSKLATMQLPDSIYNWVRDFFTDRHHCTRYAGQLSTVAVIKASVIQGSGLGPASTLSQLLICIRAQQTTTYLNMLMTPTWLCPQRTQARDAKKSSKSASGQLRII